MFPTLPTPENWKFDLVGLLAVLGEASIREVMPPLTAWPLVGLPRLLPAPQALIRPRRRLTLPPNMDARVVGVDSGNLIEHLPYFADAIHSIDTLESNTVHLWDVDIDPKFDHFRTKHISYLNGLTVLSFLLTTGLLAAASKLDDGPASLAIISLAMSGSTMSLAAQWSVQAPQRPKSKVLAKPDVVIYGKAGFFVIVRCTEVTARALYLHDTQRCKYLIKSPFYEILVLIGTLLLMCGVVFIMNCSRVMQLALGISYLLLNAAYTLAALWQHSSRRKTWNFEYVFAEPAGEPYKESTFTETLARAIELTQSSHWIRAARIAPDTPIWDEWLKKAEAAAQVKAQKAAEKAAAEAAKKAEEEAARQNAGDEEDFQPQRAFTDLQSRANELRQRGPTQGPKSHGDGAANEDVGQSSGRIV